MADIFPVGYYVSVRGIPALQSALVVLDLCAWFLDCGHCFDPSSAWRSDPRKAEKEKRVLFSPFIEAEYAVQQISGKLRHHIYDGGHPFLCIRICRQFDCGKIPIGTGVGAISL